MRIAVTGHRPDKLGNEYDGKGPISGFIVSKLQEVLDAYAGNEILPITGMALGVDMLWAELAILHGMKFIAAIPCAGQSSVWPQKSKERYQDIVTHPLCTKHWVSTEPYAPRLMMLRNMWMVDNCDLLIGVYDGSRGGTQSCLHYAAKRNREIHLITPPEGIHEHGQTTSLWKG